MEEEEISNFLSDYEPSNLVHFPTCFKNVENPSSIDLILASKACSFQNTIEISTGLSDFHKIVLTSMKAKFPKLPEKVITYRNMKSQQRCVLKGPYQLTQSNEFKCLH